MKKLILCFLIAGSAHASELAQQQFLNAVTVCPAQTNPQRALKTLKGNSFSQIEFIGSSEEMSADVIWNPQLYNPMIAAPTVIVGKITVEMTYPAPGYGLECKVKYFAIH
jgi:hypothetical protein